ncbi:hypothetical protein T03_12262 [Trichinella britovi]|uniref:Uncharacterized protein n=1 Tax=Trichinella britovi TaxID=45882 RepID=A0A0V1D1V8_TRIBR|nr:hypothetical protein T03_12262 [Trichinella britovi]
MNEFNHFCTLQFNVVLNEYCYVMTIQNNNRMEKHKENCFLFQFCYKIIKQLQQITDGDDDDL